MKIKFCLSCTKIFYAGLLVGNLLAGASALAQSWPAISFSKPIAGFTHPTDIASAGDGSGRRRTASRGGIGVEHEVTHDPLGVDPVVVLAEVRLVRRAAPQQARPVDDPQPRSGRRPRRGARQLDVQDPADLVDPLEVAAELEEVIDLGPRQRAVDQAVEEDAGPLDRVEEPGRAAANLLEPGGCRGK